MITRVCETRRRRAVPPPEGPNKEKELERAKKRKFSSTFRGNPIFSTLFKHQGLKNVANNLDGRGETETKKTGPNVDKRRKLTRK